MTEEQRLKYNEYRRSWCKANPDKVRASARKSHAKRSEAVREYRRNYRKKNTKKFRAWADQNRARHPEKLAAQTAVQMAVRSGRLIKPSNCQKCNRTGRLEGHHEDYSKQLEVIWLCHWCHREVEGRTVSRENAE